MLHVTVHTYVVRVVALTLFCFALLAGCVRQNNVVWSPETRELPLHKHATISVPEGYTYLGKTLVQARVRSEDALESIRDTFETYAFAKEDGTVLFAQRNIKGRKKYYFRFLGGRKVTIAERSWREARYSLRTDTTDREYARYVAWLNELGVTVPKQYAVTVQDRLPTRFVLLRLMTLTPAKVPAGSTGDAKGADAPMQTMQSVTEYAGGSGGYAPLPVYGKLYDQERTFDSRSGDLRVFW